MCKNANTRKKCRGEPDQESMSPRERECELIDRKLVKQVVEIFVEMGGSRNSLEVYVTDFEDMLLSTTADFYSRESSRWAEEAEPLGQGRSTRGEGADHAPPRPTVACPDASRQERTP